MRWLIAVTLVSCACPTKQTGTATAGGGGTTVGSGAGTPAGTGCDALTAKVRALYRAEPKAADEVIADNTEMVIAECRRAPDQVTACITGATTVKDLEAQCMPKLDEEGSEADVLVR